MITFSLYDCCLKDFSSSSSSFTCKWCRYFDGNLDKLFTECHVINPSKKAKMRPMSTRSSSQDLPCQICYLNYPNSVSVSSSQISLHQFLRKARDTKTVKSIEMTQVDDLFGRNVCFLSQYFTGLECGHKFCMQCWGDYLTTKIIEEGMGQVGSCSAHCKPML